MALILYELGGRDDRRYSLYSWRARMALAHKGLTPEYRPVHISDKAAIAFSKQDKVPILIDGETVVQDSFASRCTSRRIMAGRACSAARSDRRSDASSIPGSTARWCPAWCRWSPWTSRAFSTPTTHATCAA